MSHSRHQGENIRRILSIVLSLPLLSISVAPANAQQQYKLNLAHEYPSTAFAHEAASKLERLLDQVSSGRLKIHTFPQRQLGNNIVDLVTSGRAQLAIVPSTLLESKAQGLALFHTPFAFLSKAEMIAAQQGAFADQTLKQLSDQNLELVPLGFWAVGNYHIWAKQSLLERDQFKNIKFAVPGADGRFRHALSRLGAQPTRMSLADMPQDIGAAEVSLGAATSSHQSLRVLILTNHRPELLILVANKRFIDTLPKADQNLLLKGVQEITRSLPGDLQQWEDERLEQLSKRGVQVVRPTDIQMSNLASFFRPDGNVVGPACASGQKPCKIDGKCNCVDDKGQTCSC